VGVLWLAVVSSVLAGLCFLLGMHNGVYFGCYAWRPGATAGRRVAATALALLNGAVACEAASFVVLAGAGGTDTLLASVGVALVRVFLLAAVAFLFLLTRRAP
jgi:hypothetical protein